MPWRRERLPTLVFWPGEFHGLCSPWGHKELDMTEQLPLRFKGKIFYKININNTWRKGQWTNKAGHLELGSRKAPWCWWWWFGHSVMSGLCSPMDCSPLGSCVHGILQARVLEWFAISFSKGSSQPKTLLPCRWILYQLRHQVTLWCC